MEKKFDISREHLAASFTTKLRLCAAQGIKNARGSVSYTHLDVYKRQVE